jgi:hypothetical protein
MKLRRLLRKSIVTSFLALYALYALVPQQVMALSLTTNIASFWKFDESSGNASDSVGSITLTNNGTTGFVSGLVNNAADLGTANTTKYFSSASLPATGSAGNISFSMWVKVRTEASGGVSYQLWDLRDSTNGVRYSVVYQDNAGVPRISIDRVKLNVSDNFLNYNVTLGTAGWHHLVLTYDSSLGSNNLVLWVDNSNVAQVSTTGAGGPQGSNGFSIGAVTIGGSYGNYYVDAFGVWTRTLDSGDVSSLYNAGAGVQHPFAAASAPPAFWIFNDY